MATVFEGAPDARQSAAERVSAGDAVFRSRSRQLSAEEVALHDAINAKAVELYDLTLQVDPSTPARGRYAALGRTALEESVMWTIKALTA